MCPAKKKEPKQKKQNPKVPNMKNYAQTNPISSMPYCKTRNRRAPQNAIVIIPAFIKMLQNPKLEKYAMSLGPTCLIAHLMKR